MVDNRAHDSIQAVEKWWTIGLMTVIQAVEKWWTIGLMTVYKR